MLHLVLCSRSARSASLLCSFLAPRHRPALELGDRAVLLDPHHVADRVLVLLIVRVVMLAPPHRLLEHRVREAAVDPDHDRLVLLVAHHDALEHPLRHLRPPHFAFSAPRFCRAIVSIRAISRRTWRTRAVFSSWPVARWKRKLKRSFLSFNSSSPS